MEVPKRPKWVCSPVREDFDDLKNRLRKARVKFSREPREMMQAYLWFLYWYFVFQEMSKPVEDQDLPDLDDLLEPLEQLRTALDDLDHGLARLDLFEPNKSVTHTIPIDVAVNKAMAAAAIKLAPRGEKEKYAEEAARRLGVKKEHLMNFQQNLSRGLIKSHTANLIYEESLWLAKQTSSGPRPALRLLAELKPIASKRRDLE